MDQSFAPIVGTRLRSSPLINPATLRGDIMGGAVGALFLVPGLLGAGVVVFQPLGPDFLPMGIMAAFASAIIAGLMLAVIGGRTLHVNAPRPTQSALLADLLVKVGGSAAFIDAVPADSPLRIPLLVALPAAALIVSGVVQMGFGLLRLGDVVKFIPFPVIAGFVNGFVVMIIARQIPYLVGASGWGDVSAIALGEAPLNVWAVGLGAVAIVAAVQGRRFLPRIPSAVMGLTAGTLAHEALALALGTGGFGRLIGDLPAGLPVGSMVGDLWALAVHPIFPIVAVDVVATGLTLALISSIQSLLSAAAADNLFKVRHDSSRELVNQGAVNLVSALFGGTTSGGSVQYTRLAYAHGARTRLANGALGLTLVALTLGVSGVIGRVPVAVMAGVVVVTMLANLDEWTRRLARTLWTGGGGATRRELAANLGVVVVVTVLVAFAGVLPALGVGMLASVALHLHGASGSIVRRTYRAERVRSRTARPNSEMQALERNGSAIVVMELQGPVFFGSAESLASRAEAAAETGDTLILDFKRVSDVESTGAQVLLRLDGMLAGSGKQLLMANLPEDTPVRIELRDHGVVRPEQEKRVFADLNGALARAENDLLERLGTVATGEEDPEVSLSDHDSLRGLTHGQFDILSVTLRRREFSGGERIITEGDAGDAVYFLVKGQASAQRRLPGQGRTLYLAGFRPGSIVGEMAIITGEARSADVVADGPVVCYELTAADIDMLTSVDPRIPFTLLRNIAGALADRVAKATVAMFEMEK